MYLVLWNFIWCFLGHITSTSGDNDNWIFVIQIFGQPTDTKVKAHTMFAFSPNN